MKVSVPETDGVARVFLLRRYCEGSEHVALVRHQVCGKTSCWPGSFLGRFQIKKGERNLREMEELLVQRGAQSDGFGRVRLRAVFAQVDAGRHHALSGDVLSF